MSLDSYKFRDKFLFILFFIFIAILVFVETNIRVQNFYEDKINDLEVQYNGRLISFGSNMENMFASIVTEDIIKLYAKAYKTKNNKELKIVRDELKSKLDISYKFLISRGIKLFHFHLPDGTSFLRMHKPNKFGDNLYGKRETIRRIVDTKEPVNEFEAGLFFDGFRYIFPLFYDGDYIGSVELSLSSKMFLNSLNKSIDSKFFMVTDSEYLESIMKKDVLDISFHRSCINKGYYIANHTDKEEEYIGKELFTENIRDKFASKMETKENFTHIEYNSVTESKLYIFYALKDIDKRHIGYIVSIRDSNSINMTYLQSLAFILVTLILTMIVYFLYRKNSINKLELEQLIKFLNETALISKTDRSGKITYTNRRFLEVTKFKESELIGKHHRILQSNGSNREALKEMWNCLQSGEKWHGHITNVNKFNEEYTISADVFPVLGSDKETKEYISISHDITELENLKKELQNNVEEKSGIIKQYENAIKNSALLIKLDSQMRIKYLNNYFLKEIGLSKDEVLNRHFFDFIHGDDADKIFNEMLPAIKQSRQYRGIINFLRADDSVMHTKLFIQPIINGNSELQEYISISTDITEIVNLQNEIEDTQKEVIFQMGAIGESRSKETGNHVKRVAEYSKLLAQLIGMNKREAELIKQASPMHDIGKVGISDSILKKPSRLTTEEFEIMKEHSQLGFDMLKHSKREILKTASIIAYQHHEKWNGKGYPQGLKGEEIHIYGRITALSDVFDALGSDRVYKKAWELNRIVDLIREERGEHFDPTLVDLFLENIDKFVVIRNRFKDV